MKQQLLCLGLLCLMAFTSAQAQTTYYVKPAGDDGLDGQSWPNAFLTLQKAIETVIAGDEVWVAAGTYKPSEYPRGAIGVSIDRHFSFHLVNGVAIYGGFAGDEDFLSERDIIANTTILSGDIGVAANDSDNAFHVVISSEADNTTILDGFTITAGNADDGLDSIDVDGNTFWSDSGAGMFNANSSLILTNLTISNNSGDSGFGVGMFNNGSSPEISSSSISNNTGNGGYGAGMVNASSSSPVLTNVTVSNNSGVLYGGGIINLSSSPTLVNVILDGNSADNAGGGLRNESSSPSLTNVVIVNNTGTNNGGGISNVSSSSPNLTNVTVFGNSSSDGAGMYYSSNSDGAIYNTVFYDNGGDDISFTEATITGSHNYSQQDLSVLGFNQLLADPFVGMSDPDGTDNALGTDDDGLVPALGHDLRNNGDDAQNAEPNDITGQNRKLGAIDVGAYENQVPLSVHDTEIPELIMKLYPNPVLGEGMLYIKTIATLIEIRVFSLNGVLIFNQTENLHQIDVSRFAAGAYFIKAYTEQGIQSRLFVKK